MTRLTSQATVFLVDDVQRALVYTATPSASGSACTSESLVTTGYAERDGVHFHFACFRDAGPRPNHEVVPPDMFDAYVAVDDVEALYAELVERGAELLHGPVDQGYGLREIRACDPHGYIIAFGQRAG